MCEGLFRPLVPLHTRPLRRPGGRSFCSLRDNLDASAWQVFLRQDVQVKPYKPSSIICVSTVCASTMSSAMRPRSAVSRPLCLVCRLLSAPRMCARIMRLCRGASQTKR